MALVDAATASGAETAQAFPRAHAFTLFRHGVAHFQGIQALVDAKLPVEALPLLRGLVIIAARIEQITGSEQALGYMVTLALDSVDDETPGAGSASQARADRLASAAEGALHVPDQLAPITETAIWQSLALEMHLAQYAIDASYKLARLHLEPGIDASHAEFRTRSEPAPLTDLLTTAAVIAQLEMLRNAIPLFGWTADTAAIDQLLDRARQRNNTADRQANPAHSSEYQSAT